MKALLFLTLVIVSTSVYGQKSLALRVGTSHSYVKHTDVSFKERLGFLVGAQFEHRISDIVAMMVDGYYLDQRYPQSRSGSEASVRSVNAAVGAKVFVPNTGLHAIIAPEIGHLFGVFVDGNRRPATPDRFRFGYVAGLGYAFGRAGIDARYVGALDNLQSGFDFNIQVSLSFKIIK